MIWGLVGATHGGGIITHPLARVIPPQGIGRICALIMRRTPDGRIELASPTNIGNRMISLASMGVVAGHTGIGIVIKAPALADRANKTSTYLPHMVP
jgi:hypothetical protein